MPIAGGAVFQCRTLVWIVRNIPQKNRHYTHQWTRLSCETSFSGDLSPRVRGNHRRQTPLACTFRSIPACAGEPFAAAIQEHTARIYPRVCGGTPRLLYRIPDKWDLSPRVRGNHPHSRRRGHARRSILITMAIGIARSFQGCLHRRTSSPLKKRETTEAAAPTRGDSRLRSRPLLE